MNHYQQLINVVDDLIFCKGKYDNDGFSLNFDDLTEDEQAELVALKLENNDRDTSDCFYDDNVTSNLIKMLKNHSSNSLEEFSITVRDRFINYFRPALEKLIDDRLGWVTKYFRDNKEFNS